MDDNIYKAIVYTHILAAMAWVGGRSSSSSWVSGRRGRHGSAGSAQARRQIEWFGMRYFLPVSIVTFVAGVILVSQRWQFSQLWISVAMLFWLVSVIIGAHTSARARRRSPRCSRRRDRRHPRLAQRPPTLHGVAHRPGPVLRDRRAHGVEAGRQELTFRPRRREGAPRTVAALVGGIAALVIGIVSAWNEALLEAIVTPPTIVRAVLIAVSLVGGAAPWLPRRRASQPQAIPTTPSATCRAVRVRLIFLAVAAFAAAADWRSPIRCRSSSHSSSPRSTSSRRRSCSWW